MRMAEHTFDATLGALLIGGFLYTALYGNTCTLLAGYFRQCKQDGWPFRILLVVLWMMTTASIGLYTHSVYWFLVTNFDNPGLVYAGDVPWTLLGSMSFFVRCIFARRLWRLSHYDWAITAGVIALSAANLFSLIILTVVSITDPHSSALDDVQKILEAAFATSVAADVSLTAALCFFLYRSRTHIRETDVVLSELTLYTFNIGLLAVVDVIISLVLFLTVSMTSLIFVPTYIVSSILYFNSFLVSLNVRSEFRHKLDSSISAFAVRPSMGVVLPPDNPTPRPGGDEPGENVIHICEPQQLHRMSAMTV